jgi:hypothetical protein
MQYVRLYADKRGDTHFSEADLALDEADYRPPAPLLFVSHVFQSGLLQFVRPPSGWTGEGIHPLKRQFLICLEGHLDGTVSDGEKRSFGPGDRVLTEGVDGKGHPSHARGAHDCVVAIVPID